MESWTSFSEPTNLVSLFTSGKPVKVKFVKCFILVLRGYNCISDKEFYNIKSALFQNDILLMENIFLKTNEFFLWYWLTDWFLIKWLLCLDIPCKMKKRKYFKELNHFF